MKVMVTELRMGLLKTAITGLFLLTASFAATVPLLAATFPIATNAASQSMSYDGTNYLIGLESHATSPPSIGAQMLGADGSPVGSPIMTGRSGIATNVAFDGTRYLLIWEDDALGTATGATGWQIYGQFITKGGAASGSPFAISSTGMSFDGVRSMAFGGGKYLVTYTKYTGGTNNRYIMGRFVNTDGSLGTEFRISTNYGKASDVAFDGTNFFVVWCEDSLDQAIRGRFVDLTGTPGTEISINASTAPSDNPKSVAFDGTNYLVVWNDETSGANTGTWDVFGQRVGTSGALVGGVITVTNEAGPQVVTTLAYDGAKYLALWMDMSNDANHNGVCDTGEGTCWDLYGQYIRPNGSLIDGKITISNDTTNQMGGVGYANGKFLALINSGVIMGENGISQVASSSLLTITPPTNQFSASATYTYTGDASGGTINFNWTSTNFVCNGPELGTDSYIVTSLTATTMIWPPQPNNEHGMTWTRTTGTAGDPTGTWTLTDAASGMSYTAVLANGTISLSGTTDRCAAALHVTINGNGNVNSDSGTPGIHASSPGTYDSPYFWNSPVTLTAAPATGYTFGSWGGACFGSQLTCSLSMDSEDKDVTAQFNVNVQQNIRSATNNAKVYATIQAALNDATTNDDLQMRAMTFSEPVVLNLSNPNILLGMLGGYVDSLFTDESGISIINGSLTIQSGALNMKNIAIW